MSIDEKKLKELTFVTVFSKDGAGTVMSQANAERLQSQGEIVVEHVRDKVLDQETGKVVDAIVDTRLVRRR